MVSDRVPGLGPLAGLEAGLRVSRYEYAFLCAVDMPFINEALVRFMVQSAPGYDIVVPVVGGEYEPCTPCTAGGVCQHLPQPEGVGACA